MKSGDRLTDRELQVLLLVAQGFTDKAVASKLLITERTVRFHVHRIAQKFGYHREPDRNVRVRIAKDPRCHDALNTVTVESASK